MDGKSSTYSGGKNPVLSGHFDNTTPIGIKSLEKIEMPALKTLINRLKNVEAMPSDETTLKVFLDVDKEYKRIKREMEESKRMIKTDPEAVQDKETLKEKQNLQKESKDKTKEVTEQQSTQADTNEIDKLKEVANKNDENKNNIESSIPEEVIAKEEQKLKDKIESLTEKLKEGELENSTKKLQDKCSSQAVTIDNMTAELQQRDQSIKSYKDNVDQLNLKLSKLGHSSQKLQDKCSKQDVTIQYMKSELQQRDQSIKSYKDNEDKLYTQINDLKLRLSQVAGSKLSDNNPSITDLSDPNRPQKIAEQFSELYDNEWTDALEMLQGCGNSEREAIDKLISTVKTCFQYCQEISEKQMNQMSCVLCLCQDENGYGFEDLEKEVVKAMKDLRKMTGLEEYSITWLAKGFRNSEGYKQLPKESANENFSKYIDVCLKCAWLSIVQDPPVVLDFDLKPSSDYDSNYTKEYTKSGKYVDYLVWPCMLRCKAGPLLNKGVVQCTNFQNGGTGEGDGVAVTKENEAAQKSTEGELQCIKVQNEGKGKGNADDVLEENKTAQKTTEDEVQVTNVQNEGKGKGDEVAVAKENEEAEKNTKDEVQRTIVQNEGKGKGNADDVPEENETAQKTTEDEVQCTNVQNKEMGKDNADGVPKGNGTAQKKVTDGTGVEDKETSSVKAEMTTNDVSDETKNVENSKQGDKQNDSKDEADTTN